MYNPLRYNSRAGWIYIYVQTVTVKDYRVELTWNEPLDPGELPIIEYRIYRGTRTSAMELIATVNGTSYIDNNLVSGVKYYYIVFAVNGNGMSLNPGLVDATISASPENDPY